MEFRAEIKRTLTGPDKLRAVCSVILDDCFLVKNVRVVEGEKGLFVSLPSRRNVKGEWTEQCFPMTKELREKLSAVVLPRREEFVTLWRYLKGPAGQAPLEATAHRLARSIARSAGRRETVMRTLVCLEVFDERGLIRLEHTTDHLHIALRSVDGKVNLDDSCIMRKLRHILSNG